jgi:hypothetical protein
MISEQLALALGRLAAFVSFSGGRLGPDQHAVATRAARRCVELLLQPSSESVDQPMALGARNPTRLSSCEPLALARVSYALGRLGLRDSALSEVHLVSASFERLHLFAPEALAALLAGMAAQGCAPPEPWLQRVGLETYAR